MPPRSHHDALYDILDAIDKVGGFIAGMTYEQFAVDDKTVFAVLRALEVIGEAARNIPSALRDEQPQIQWREIAGMRDKLIHQYFGVDLKVVWKTLGEDLPPLRAAVVALLRNALPQ
jgi:uncharacterized protein with HEPN domain